jgi:hypothetical protein
MSAFVINSYAFAKAIVPTDISNLVVWLDAGLGLFDATRGGSAVTTDASAVSRWEDQSGNANHFTQGISASRPILKTAIQNSLNVIRFDGSNDAVACASSALFKNISGATVFSVRKCASNPTSEQNIFRANIGTANSSRIFFSVGFNSGKANAGGRRLDADGFAGIQSTNNVSTSVFQIQSALYDYTNTGRQPAYSLSRGQYGVMGVWAASQCGVDIPEDYWRLVEDAWTKAQFPNGAWNYGEAANFPPSARHAAMQATATRAAIRPYSIAVAPDSSLAKRFMRLDIGSTP